MLSAKKQERYQDVLENHECWEGLMVSDLLTFSLLAVLLLLYFITLRVFCFLILVLLYRFTGLGMSADSIKYFKEHQLRMTLIYFLVPVLATIGIGVFSYMMLLIPLANGDLWPFYWASGGVLITDAARQFLLSVISLIGIVMSSVFSLMRLGLPNPLKLGQYWCGYKPMRL